MRKSLFAFIVLLTAVVVASSACAGGGSGPTVPSVAVPPATTTTRSVINTFVGDLTAMGSLKGTYGVGLRPAPDTPGGLLDAKITCAPDSNSVQGYLFLEQDAWSRCGDQSVAECPGYVFFVQDSCHTPVAMTISREFVVARINFYVMFRNRGSGDHHLEGEIGLTTK